MMSNVREPIKKTSIEKKKRIVEKGFELMCEKGYHNITCVDIAKYADTSTGSIYQYFNDKREIFLEGVKDYSNKILFPMIDILETTKLEEKNLKETIEKMIDSFINTHTMSKNAHEELMAMTHLDQEVAELFHESEIRMTDKISKVLIHNGIKIENQEEKIHIMIGLVDNLCHEFVYHKHQELNFKTMKEIVITTILHLLNEI